MQITKTGGTISVKSSPSLQLGQSNSGKQRERQDAKNPTRLKKVNLSLSKSFDDDYVTKKPECNLVGLFSKLAQSEPSFPPTSDVDYSTCEELQEKTLLPLYRQRDIFIEFTQHKPCKGEEGTNIDEKHRVNKNTSKRLEN